MKSIYKRMTVLISVFLLAMAVFLISPFCLGGKVMADTTVRTGYVKSGPLFVRKGPGVSYSRVGTLKEKAAVSITGSSGSWYKIRYKSLTRYVYKKHIAVKYVTVTYSPKKRAKVISTVNARKGPGASYKSYGTLKMGTTAILAGYTTKNGSKWYKTTYASKTAYAKSTYLIITGAASSDSTDFESYMKQQGFPDSYKPYLRILHRDHPKWVFKAQDTGIYWSSALAAEQGLGVSVVSSSTSSKWKSKETGAYDPVRKKYVVFDGAWNQASDAVVAYYLDPRNFITEKGIYQFMGHSFDPASQTTATIKSLVDRNSCFMNSSGYIKDLYYAGKDAAVNPNVLTSMVIVEQGWRGGSGLISGNYSGYNGYYNHFNIGAFTTAKMNAVQHGLWWAKGAGTGATTYGRPWNSKYKSLKGGAAFYSSNYLTNHQYTYYTKRFNVLNGLKNVARHQYSTCITGAESEGNLVRYAYSSSDDYPICFYIPVYRNMPAAVYARPAE